MGFSEAFWKPTVLEDLEDYSHAIPLFSIWNNSAKLLLQKQELKEKSRGSDTISNLH